jgi:hypothetical protein
MKLTGMNALEHRINRLEAKVAKLENFIPNEPKTVSNNECKEIFIKDVIKNLKHTDPEYVDIVNENFWSLF